MFEKRHLNNSLILMLLLIHSLSLFSASTFSLYSRVSLVLNISILGIIVFLENKIRYSILKDLIYINLFTIYCLIAILLNNGGIGSVLTATVGLLVIVILSSVDIKKSSLKPIFFIYLLLLLFYFFNSENSYYLTQQSSFALNSNTIGQIIMYTCMYLIIFVKNYNINFNKILALSILLIGLIGVANAESRGTFVCLLAFGVLDFFIPKKLFYKKKNTLLIFSFVIIIGIFLPIIYTNMYKNGMAVQFSFTDKSFFSGREGIWLDTFSALKNNKDWFFGLGSDQLLYNQGSQNLHNTYLSFLANFGVIGFVFYYIFVLKKIADVYKTDINDTTVSCLIGYLTVLLNGNFETTFLWTPMIFFPTLFLVLALSDNRISYAYDYNEAVN